MSENIRDYYKSKFNLGQEIIYLSMQDCKDTGTTVQEIVDATETAMILYAKKETEMPAKIGLHPMPDSLMHAMPAYIKSAQAAGIKWGSNFPTNNQLFPELTPTNCQIIFNDCQSGLAMAIIDATWITEVRTPATALASHKYGANPGSTTFGMIGCGIQGRANVKMMESIIPTLETIYVYDLYEAAMDRLIKECQPEVKAKIVKCTNPEDAVKNSQVITSAVPISHVPAPFIKKEWVQKGASICCLDCHSAFEDEVYKTATRYYVDSIEQHELLVGYGYYPHGLPTITGESGALMGGMVKGRETADDILIFNNVGMAVEDMLCAKMIFGRALEQGLGVKLPLWDSTANCCKK